MNFEYITAAVEYEVATVVECKQEADIVSLQVKILPQAASLFQDLDTHYKLIMKWRGGGLSAEEQLLFKEVHKRLYSYNDVVKTIVAMRETQGKGLLKHLNLW